MPRRGICSGMDDESPTDETMTISEAVDRVLARLKDFPVCCVHVPGGDHGDQTDSAVSDTRRPRDSSISASGEHRSAG